MRTLLNILILLAFLYSCNERKSEAKPDKLFDVTYHLLKVDTNILGAQYFNGYYLLQLGNNNFAVLDTNFNRQKNIEQLLTNTKTTFFYRRGDTTILASETKNYRTVEFQLTNDFKLEPMKPRIHEKQVFNGRLFFEDSTYQIYGCCAGEFGGSLFFYNKKNTRLYFYSSSCVDQVIFYRDSYYIFQNLYNASYVRIEYPQELIELKYKSRVLGCGWQPGADSIRKYEENKIVRNLKGPVYYERNYRDRSLNSFLLNDTLFTIFSSDSATYMAMHQGDSLKIVQKLLNKRVWVHRTFYEDDAGRRIVYFNATLTQWNSTTNAATDKTNSGFLVINGRKIDIAEYPTRKDYIMK